MTRGLFTSRPTASPTQMFLGLSLIFLWGCVAFVIFPPAGVAIWALAGLTLYRRLRVAREDREARAASQQRQESWDDQWNRWGGRPPESL